MGSAENDRMEDGLRDQVARIVDPAAWLSSAAHPGGSEHQRVVARQKADEIVETVRGSLYYGRLIVQTEFYTRETISCNPDTFYVFGDNEDRVGRGGQAAACRGMPNAIGIPTKRTPGHSEPDYWSDREYDRCAAIISAGFDQIELKLVLGYDVVWPAAGIGTGLSELPTRAPRIMSLIETKLQELKESYGNV